MSKENIEWVKFIYLFTYCLLKVKTKFTLGWIPVYTGRKRTRRSEFEQDQTEFGANWRTAALAAEQAKKLVLKVMKRILFNFDFIKFGKLS